MKEDPIKEIFLTKDQLRLPQTVIEYLINLRKAEESAIKNQAPTRIPQRYHLAVCLIFSIILTILNFDQLFQKAEAPTEVALLQNYDDVEKKVEYVFENTIMRYSILYPMKLTECQSYIPFIPSDTLCSEKSIDVKAKLVYSIGFKPNYEKLSYSSQNNSISGEWGPLEILSMTEDHEVQTQNNGFINGWSVIQFETKYHKKIKDLEPQFNEKVNQYIENINSNENSLQKLESNIKNSLMKLVNDGKGEKKSLSDRILSGINKGFDKLLIFLSIDPLLQYEQKVERDEFSPQFATQFYRQQVFVEEKKNEKVQTSVSEVNKVNEPEKVRKTGQIDSIPEKPQAIGYSSDQIRQKYNALLKKVK